MKKDLLKEMFSDQELNEKEQLTIKGGAELACRQATKFRGADGYDHPDVKIVADGLGD